MIQEIVLTKGHRHSLHKDSLACTGWIKGQELYYSDITTTMNASVIAGRSNYLEASSHLIVFRRCTTFSRRFTLMNSLTLLANTHFFLREA